jgi:hypothetical protein
MRLLFTILLFFLCAGINAQNRLITGTVTDQNSTPVPNASVLAKGTKSGVTTDANGTFSISVPASVNTLEISSLNYATAEC